MVDPAVQSDPLSRWTGTLPGVADPTRLRLLRLLERHELGVAELCDVLQMPQSTVSRHLKLLADEGWVVSRRNGTTNLYRMVLDELDSAARQLWLLARGQTEDCATFHQDQVRLMRRLRERHAAARGFFTGAAGDWDRLRTELYGDGFNTDAVVALMPRDWVVADLGCGTGQLSAQLARFAKRVIGVDNTPAMLKAAAARTADLPHVELREGDLESLPIEDATCDAALMVLVATYLPDPAPAFAEMRRVLRTSKPGGRAVVVDLLRHDREDFRREFGQQHPGFDPEQMRAMLVAAGFTDVTVCALPPEPKAKGPALLLATANRTA